MTDESKEKIELIPAEDNPWYKFFLKSLELDATHNKHRGWHWFWGIYHLHDKIKAFPKIYLKGIQASLPDDHWLNKPSKNPTHASTANDKNSKTDATNALHKFLQEPHPVEKITEIDLSKLFFPIQVDFSNFIFPITISFSNSHFRSIFFFRAHFLGSAYFAKTIFHQSNVLNGNFPSHTTFKEATFYRDVDFNEAQLKEPFYFTETKFIQSTSFIKVTFSATIDFSKTEFQKIVAFNNSKFCEIVSFNSTSFFEVSEFSETEFLKEADFIEANFVIANFFKAKFYNTANFADATFSHIAGFRRVTFSDLVRFNNVEFGGGSSFADTIFETHAPHFYSAKMSEDITWDRVKFPSIKRDTNRDLVQQNKEAYENLSGHMEKMKKHDDQHLFFRQEMRCRRWLGSPFNHLIHGLYEWFADYGYGVGYALCWWAGHIALGVIVIVFIAMCGGMQYYDSLPCAISVSFANANPYALFSFDSVKLAACYDMFNVHAPILFAIVKVIQTILGVGLLFLVLLTLRIRFRLK